MATKDDKAKRTRTRKPKAAASAPAAGDDAQSPAAPAEAVVPESAAAPVDDAPQVPAPVSSAPLSLDEQIARFADLTRVVVFVMDGQRYALPIESVQEIQQIVAISDMPGSAGAVLGVINLRGQVIPAIDMRTLVGLPVVEPGLDTPMVLAYTAHGLVALVVDEVEDVVEVPPGSMQTSSPVHALADKLLGVCTLDEGLVFVFDMDRLVPAHMVSGVTS